LYSEFKPERYELYLEPDREQAKFSGRVKIIGRKTGRPSQRLTFHQKGLKLKSAVITKLDKKIGEQKIEIDRHNTHGAYDELRLHTKELLHSGTYVIEIEFSGQITEPMHGMYPCNFELDGQKKQLIATQFESHHAREVFPCIDEPEAKAVFSLSLKTPATETVISNTPVLSETPVSAQKVTTFEDTPKMSTYLLAFVYGELAYKEAVSKNGAKVRIYSTPDKINLTDFGLDVSVKSLEFFEDYFGVPYPLAKLDVIGLPDFSAGAMENWGLITFRESVLYVDPKSSSIETKQYVAMVVAHEVAHMWFGNLVTMRWWNDLWLNESFATLMEYRAVDQLYPEWNIWRDFVQREVGSALSRDALPNVQAVQTQVNHPDELGALFDPSIVYAKGGGLLNMVRRLVGEDSFRAGLKSYFEEFKYANTIADDLWHHLEQASGIDIKSIMENWLTQPGFPILEVDYRPSDNKFLVSQRRLVISSKKMLSQTLWQVPMEASVPIGQKILDKKTADIKLEIAGTKPLTLNHDGSSYFVSHYLNPEHLGLILQAVQQGRISPIDRLLLLQNNLLLERAGIVSTLQNIQLLPFYAGEREETVWGMVAGIIGNARSLIGKDEALESKLNAFVRPIVQPLVKELGWKSSSNDSSQTQKMRSLSLSLAAVAEDSSVVVEGLKLFKSFEKPSDLAPDIRSIVYFIGVRYGASDDFEKLIKLHNSLTNADEIDEVAAELTATREPERAVRLLKMLKTDVRTQDLPHWMAWLMRNRYSTDIAWGWLQNNWQWIEDKYASDKSFDYFPRYAAMNFSYPKQLKEFRAFFEPKNELALKRAVELGVEEIQGRIAWRTKNEAAVKAWLG